jgi:ketosteroid isomerase-like protein
MSDITEPLKGPAEELRQIVLERVAAVQAKDPQALAARQAADLVTFDVLAPLRSRGSEADTQKARSWFDGYATEIGYEVRELEVAADGDVGFCSFLYHVSGTLTAGGEVDMWVRATLGCRRIDGRWLITHDHESVPFDPASGQALTDLAP